MATKQIVIGTLVVAAVAGAFLALRGGGAREEARPEPAEREAPTAEPTRPTPRPPLPPPATPQVADAGAAQEIAIPEPSGADAPVRIPRAQVLATIDGAPITVADLVPLEPGATEARMTKPELDARLNTEIEARLTIAEARARGLDPVEVKQRKLEQLRAEHAAELDALKSKGVYKSSLTEEAIEKEAHEIAALTLQQSMVAADAKVAPSPNPGEQARYEEARRQLLERLKSKSKVEIKAP